MVRDRKSGLWWKETHWDPSGITPFQLAEFGVGSIEELRARRDERIAARSALSEFMARPDVSGPDKQRAKCAFTHRFGRLPYQCSGCWLLPGYCVCAKLRKAAQPLSHTKLVIHLHQDEWGRGSNTGCLCAGTLSGDCQLLLRGHTPHDEQLEALLADPSFTTALLWPSGDAALEPHQLQELAAERSGGRIALVAIDATWSGAVKMRKKYPADMLTVRLPPDLALPQLHHVAAITSSSAPSPQQQQQQQQQDRPGQQPGTAAASEGSRQGIATPNSSSSSSTSSGSSRHDDVGNASSSSTQHQQQQHQQPGAVSSQAAASSSKVAVADAASQSPPPQPQRQWANRHVPALGERASLFRGVRKYHGKAVENGRVSTLEAVAAALLALEGCEDIYSALLFNLALKVDAVRRQKHMPVVYGLGVEGEEGEGGDE